MNNPPCQPFGTCDWCKPQTFLNWGSRGTIALTLNSKYVFKHTVASLKCLALELWQSGIVWHSRISSYGHTGLPSIFRPRPLSGKRPRSAGSSEQAEGSWCPYQVEQVNVVRAPPRVCPARTVQSYIVRFDFLEEL